MTVEEVKELLPIIQAFVDGKIIQYRGLKGDWVDYTNPEYLSIKFLLFSHNYRVKPEPKYRPFKTKEECWEEMHKHPDFGWVKCKQCGSYVLLGNIGKDIIKSTDECHKDSIDYIYEAYTFTDGEPFGIKI